MHPNRATSGFTLIELMIVVTILAIVASIAIPNLMSARSTANDKSIVAALRSISTAQVLARTHTLIDTDRDGQGEASTLPEMAGTTVVRGLSVALRPPYLSVALGMPDSDGHVLNHGFYFALYLPDAAGAGLASTAANFASVSADLAESYWTCLAWPRERLTQGNATYFVNQNGDIVASKMATYSGKTQVPPAGAALLGVGAGNINSSTIAIATIGADGNLWKPVN